MIRLTVLLTFISLVAFSQQENVFLTRKVNKGIYYTYQQFLTNSPAETDNFTCKPVDKTYLFVPNSTFIMSYTLYPNKTGKDTTQLMYMLYDSIKKNRKITKAYAFCDGKDVFINSALYQNHSNYYLKVLDFGRILYTRDPIMDQAAGVGTGAILGGLIGGAIGYLSANKDSRGVIIFCEDGGVPFILNRQTITSLLQNYAPDLYKKYQAEADRGDEAVLEKYVLLFNQQYP